MRIVPTRVRYGQLNCIQVDCGDAPEVLVVALHGYGAPGEDLVPIAENWIQVLGDAASKVRFLFPAALLSLADQGMPGARAWWPLNMQRLMDLVAAEDYMELCVHEPPGIDAARSALTTSLNEAMTELGIDESKLVLGGFSQGAMLSMDVAVRGLQHPPAGLFLYSGMLICEQAWKAGSSRLVNTYTIQSHGSFDPILPFAVGEALYAMLKVAGVPIEFFPFEGPHTLTLAALDATAKVISNLAAPTE